MEDLLWPSNIRYKVLPREHLRAKLLNIKAAADISISILYHPPPPPHIKSRLRGTWVVEWVKRPTLGFGSSHDLTTHEFEPRIGLHADGACL